VGFSIDLHACGKSFLDHWVFKDKTLQLQTAEKVALLGPNGAGKSTLMLLLCGYLQPTEGEVRFALNGKPLSQQSIGAHISMCLPNMETFEEFTLRELLDMHISLRSMCCEQNTDAIMQLLRFTKSEGQKQIRFFSNGMRQRLKLGLALLTDSSAVFLDEPLTNMDTSGKDLYYSWLETYLGNRLLVVASNREDEYTTCTRFIHINEKLPQI
jgi:ABC-type multidrug transport system ATPase subunit